MDFKVLYRSGKALCSKVDPVREARRWLDVSKRWIEWTDIVCVLGLGSGYHIIELNKRYPDKKIIVIESELSIINEFRIANTFMQSLQILNFVELNNLDFFLKSINPELKRMIILSFIPAWVDFEVDYEKLKLNLLGTIEERIENIQRIKKTSSVNAVDLICSELIK